MWFVEAGMDERIDTDSEVKSERATSLPPGFQIAGPQCNRSLRSIRPRLDRIFDQAPQGLDRLARVGTPRADQ